jgi:hypothetical protein
MHVTSGDVVAIVCVLLIVMAGTSFNLWLTTRYLNRRFPRPVSDGHALMMTGDHPNGPDSAVVWAARCRCGDWSTSGHTSYDRVVNDYRTHVRSLGQ